MPNNEAVLKAAFKPKRGTLKSSRTLSRSQRTWRKQPKQLRPKSMLNWKTSTRSPNRKNSTQNQHQKLQSSPSTNLKPCESCWKKNLPKDKCCFREAECHYCRKKATLKSHATASKLRTSGVPPQYLPLMGIIHHRYIS